MLGERLRLPDARAVAKRLPPELGRHLHGRSNADERLQARPAEALVRELRARTGLTLEHTRAICRMLAEMLDEQGRAQLRMQPLTRLFLA